MEHWSFAIHFNILEDLVTQFKEKHNPDYDFETEEFSPDNIAQEVASALQAQQELPDSTVMRDQQMRPLTDSDVLTSTNDLISKYDDEMYNAAQSRMAYGEDVMQIPDDPDYFVAPTDFASGAILYNRDLYSEAGLPTDRESLEDEIQTWQDFIDAGKQVEAETGAKMFTMERSGRGSLVPYQLLGQAGSIFYNRDGEFAFNNGSNKKAMRVVRALDEVNQPMTEFGDQYFQAYRDEEVASIISPQFHYFILTGTKDSRGALSEMSGKWGGFALPRQADIVDIEPADNAIVEDETPRATAPIGAMTGIPAGIGQNRITASKEFVEFAHFSDEAVTTRLEWGAFPGVSRPNLDIFDLEDEYFAGQQIHQLYHDSAENAPRVYNRPNQDVVNIKREAFRRILVEDADIDETLDQAHEDMVATFG
jgi:ABC-type glycerol-3-phosphate transport system substrate-binding protein